MKRVQLKALKGKKKTEVNYLPPLPFGETEETLENERLYLLKEMKKKNNERTINEKLDIFGIFDKLESLSL